MIMKPALIRHLPMHSDCYHDCHVQYMMFHFHNLYSIIIIIINQSNKGLLVTYLFPFTSFLLQMLDKSYISLKWTRATTIPALADKLAFFISYHCKSSIRTVDFNFRFTAGEVFIVIAFVVVMLLAMLTSQHS